jgi:hypothetical protein
MELRFMFLMNGNDGFQPVRRGHHNKDTSRMHAAIAVDKMTGKDGRQINPSGKRHRKPTKKKSINHFDGLVIEEDTSEAEDVTYISSTDSESDSSCNMTSDDDQDIISNNEVGMLMKAPYTANNCFISQLADSLPSRTAPKSKGCAHCQNKPKAKQQRVSDAANSTATAPVSSPVSGAIEEVSDGAVLSASSSMVDASRSVRRGVSFSISSHLISESCCVSAPTQSTSSLKLLMLIWHIPTPSQRTVITNVIMVLAKSLLSQEK